MRRNKAVKIREYFKMAVADADYLTWCAKLTDAQRLRWLEEANRFLRVACSDKVWKIRMKLREMGA